MRNIFQWFGFGMPEWLRESIARRNMPVVAVGTIVLAVFSGMLAFCLLTGIPCPVEGFDESAYVNPAVTMRYTLTSSIATLTLVFIAVFSILYNRKKWKCTGLATACTLFFAFIMVMIWGIADSGNSADRQMLIFASIQFLVAGLLITTPTVSLAYFACTFFLFGMALELSGQLSPTIMKDLVYLALLDVVVCWVIYGLFKRAVEREQSVIRQSYRDELTGAKNRHALRDDFPAFMNASTFVMLCDIDEFKRYNDEYDHDVGDYTLVQFYFALREAFGDECVYRYGGDEFLIVSVEFGEEEFRKKLDKASAQLGEVEVEGQRVGLTFSGGYSRGMASDYETFRSLLHEADENLLKAKRTGKNRVVG